MPRNQLISKRFQADFGKMISIFQLLFTGHFETFQFETLNHSAWMIQVAIPIARQMVLSDGLFAYLLGPFPPSIQEIF